MSLKCISFCSLKRGDCEKNVTLCFHLFPPKNISLISSKGNIGLLLICILQAWKWAFKHNFWFSITGEPLCFANYNTICRSRWKQRHHVFGHVWINLLLFAKWKLSCKRKKIIWSDLFPTVLLNDKKYIRFCLDLIDRALVKTTDYINLMQAKGYAEFTIQHTHFIFSLLMNVYV